MKPFTLGLVAKRLRGCSRNSTVALASHGKDLNRIESDTHTGKDKSHAQPGPSSRSYLPFRLQVILNGQGKKDYCQGHEHESQRGKTRHDRSHMVIFTRANSGVSRLVSGHTPRKTS